MGGASCFGSTSALEFSEKPFICLFPSELVLNTFQVPMPTTFSTSLCSLSSFSTVPISMLRCVMYSKDILISRERRGEKRQPKEKLFQLLFFLNVLGVSKDSFKLLLHNFNENEKIDGFWLWLLENISIFNSVLAAWRLWYQRTLIASFPPDAAIVRAAKWRGSVVVLSEADEISGWKWNDARFVISLLMC